VLIALIALTIALTDIGSGVLTYGGALARLARSAVPSPAPSAGATSA
jgi:hypothetical protein